MLRTKKALKVLTGAEQRHLTVDANVHSMEGFRRTIEQHRKWEQEPGACGGATCLDCRKIAQKLGV